MTWHDTNPTRKHELPPLDEAKINCLGLEEEAWERMRERTMAMILISTTQYTHIIYTFHEKKKNLMHALRKGAKLSKIYTRVITD